MYYHARYYDPRLGRFLSPDTLVPDPANPQDLNRYSYVRNNPVNATDPTGHYIELTRQEAAEFRAFVLRPMISAIQENDLAAMHSIAKAAVDVAGTSHPAAGVVAVLAGFAIDGAYDASQVDLNALLFLSEHIDDFHDVSEGYANMTIRIGTKIHLYKADPCLGLILMCRTSEAELYVRWGLPDGSQRAWDEESISMDLARSMYPFVGDPMYRRYVCEFIAAPNRSACTYHSTLPDYEGPPTDSSKRVAPDPWDFDAEDLKPIASITDTKDTKRYSSDDLPQPAWGHHEIDRITA